jgi:thymidylate kinase
VSRTILVTFSGLDGAGKTTLIRDLASELRSSGHRVRILTMYDDVSLYSYLRALRDRPRGRARHAGASGGGVAGSGPLYSLVRSAPVRRLAYAGDLLSLTVRRLYHQRLRGEILILDRYLYDTLADAAAGGWPSLSTLLRLTPRPDVPILVDVEPADAFARRAEYDVAYLTERRATYRRLFARIDGALVVRNDDREIASRAVRDAVAERLR